MEESEALIAGLCPAGAEEETSDYDISIDCGSLGQGLHNYILSASGNNPLVIQATS